jgi:surfeit locus 1 family protein
VRRIPVFATLIVLIAVGIMIRLGFWQLDRMHEKDALLARYAAESANPQPVAFPAADPRAAEAVLYRRSRVACQSVIAMQSIAGRNDRGQLGYVHVALCGIGAGNTAHVQTGWSASPNPPRWGGGDATGTIAPFGEGFAKLVADPPLAGLAASARPDPNDLPNNHWSYAIQWFLFALTALVIYAIALRKRLKP